MEKRANGVPEYEEQVRKGPKPFNFWRGLYNKDKNYFLGRTPKNWGELAVFYSVFYIVLGILFTICMKGLYSTLDEKVPRWTLKESRIGDNPGLGFRPMPNKTQGSLIWLNAKNATKYVHIIDKFLKPYKEAANNSVDCNFNSPAPAGKVCSVKLNQFGKCSSTNMYGYKDTEMKPCIFLKLNRIFDWKPKQFKGSYPDQMPTELKAYVNSLPEAERDQIFVSCQGQHEADKEHIGTVTVMPKGFPHYYYPYTNEDGYLSPLVSVQFESLKKNTNINIECIAWAPNIIYRGGERDRQGSIHFEILID